MIYVCNLVDMPVNAAVLGVSHLVSLVPPEEQPPTPSGIRTTRHHRVAIHDISEPIDGYVLAERRHIAALIDFVAGWRPQQGALMIHCLAGVSRSMAAALITLVIKAGGREAEAAEHLRRAAPHAWPNRRMIALADELLCCQGRLVAARKVMGPAEIELPTPLARVSLLD
jgi:predicted protein tyrosine phosphatase